MGLESIVDLMWQLVIIYLKILWPMLVPVRIVWDTVMSYAMCFVSKFKRRRYLPPVFNPLLLLPATKLAENIRLRKMTSVEIVRAFVRRSSDVNPILNAIVQENFKEALQNARTIDDRINLGYADGSLTPEILKVEEPFLGVPFTVKETISVQGFPHTAGLLVRSNERANNDAIIVERMKEAGSILLATTNVAELGMWWECSNKLYGRTNNPYDTRRTSGGSSGGEAALMCSCSSPLSIGTDTGGSIRTPAFFCGLFGHKPTAGLVPVDGCNIREVDVDKMEVQVPGPITRHSEDIIPVLTVLAGEKKAAEYKLQEKVHLGRLKFYMMPDDGNRVTTSSVIPALKRIQRRVIEHFLIKYDLDVARVRISDFQNSYIIWREKMSEDFSNEPPISQQLLDRKGEINVWTETLRGFLGNQRYSFASLIQAILDKCVGQMKFFRDQTYLLQGKTPPSQRFSYRPGWRKLRMKLQRFLGDNGILLYPSHPTLAPYHRESYYKPLNFTYAAIFNALGFPVTQVPLGLDPSTGLPLGIQVVGSMHMDRLTIAVAKDLETAFGGWTCPAKML